MVTVITMTIETPLPAVTIAKTNGKHQRTVMKRQGQDLGLLRVTSHKDMAL